MADLNDPVDAAKSEDPAGEPVVADKAADAEPTNTAAASEPTETVTDARADETPTAVKPSEAVTAEQPATTPDAPAAEAASPAAEVTEAEAAQAAEAKPAVETKPAADAEPAVEGKPAEPEAEAEAGTVLPDSIVAGAAAPAVPDGSKDSEDSDESESVDDSGDEGAPTAAKPSRKPRKPIARPRPLVAALSLLLVLLLAAGVTLFVHNHKVSSAEASRAAALDTARQVATSLTTITPDNAAGQIDDLTKHSTGSFKDQIGGYSAMFQAVLKQGNVASRGTITAAGVEKMEGDAASAIVAVSALITSGQVPQGQPRTYRLLVSLQRSGDQWLASNVDFVQ